MVSCSTGWCLGCHDMVCNLQHAGMDECSDEQNQHVQPHLTWPLQSRCTCGTSKFMGAHIYIVWSNHDAVRLHIVLQVVSFAPPHSSLSLPSGDDYITSFECQNSVQIPAPMGKTQCGYSYRARFPAPNQSLYYSGQSNPLFGESLAGRVLILVCWGQSEPKLAPWYAQVRGGFQATGKPEVLHPGLQQCDDMSSKHTSRACNLQ